MNETGRSRPEPSGQEFDIEILARECRMSIQAVKEIYVAEHTKLEQRSRIKTYVPVLIRRHVKELLRTQRVTLGEEIRSAS